MSEPEATVSTGRRRFPLIWLLPIVAAVLGIWIVIFNYLTEGPEITISFSTAEGIEAGKTKIKYRSVDVGLVEAITIPDLEGIQVEARLDRRATALLRDDTRFWVVRPRFDAAGISGLGTVLSGAYIEVEPGQSAPSGKRDYVGLEDLPVTPVGTPGLRLVLVSRRAGSAGAGDPVLFQGFRVGRVEHTTFDAETERVRHEVFIDAPYDRLVNGATRFWEESGISLEASTEGVRIEIGSLQTLLAGGVAFAVPEGKSALGPVESGAEFMLYDSYASTEEEIYEYGIDFVVSFTQSVRGLSPGAPVSYRGLRIGTVREILRSQLVRAAMQGKTNSPIPVLIRIEPGRLEFGDSPQGMVVFKATIERSVAAGMRLSLQSGNLITGNLFIAADFYPEDPGEIGSHAGYPTLPTTSGGLARIERQVSELLAKLNDLPLDTTVRQLNGAIADVRSVVGSDEFKQLPASLNATLAQLTATLGTLSPDSPLYLRLNRAVIELNRTLQTAEELLRNIDEKPSSLIFSRPIRLDPEPRGAP